jgi:uncharacterized protein (TIGR03437 family)
VRYLLLFLAAVGSAAGQNDIFDLATTGDGNVAYFASRLVTRDSGEAQSNWVSPPGRIYRIGPQGLEQYLKRSESPGEPGFTNYYDLSVPQTSGDGTVVGVIGRRRCLTYAACGVPSLIETTITGLPGGTIDVAGYGRLSGNGRYMLIFGPRECAYVADLQAKQESQPGYCVPGPGGAPGRGRPIADDGTAVATAGSLYVIRGQSVTRVDTGLGTPGEGVIDSAARRVVYSFWDWSVGRRSIRIYRIPEQRDAVLAAPPGADSHAPYISSDGRRVMFLSDASGPPQIYTISTDGGEPLQVTHDRSGVLSAAMSDDGNVAWYLSGASRFCRLDLNTGDARQWIGRTPQFGNGLPAAGPTVLTAGSRFTIQGAGFSDLSYAAGTYPLPQSLGEVSVSVNGVDGPLISVSPTEIVFQVPLQTAPQADVEVRTGFARPFIPRLLFRTAVFASSGQFLHNVQSPSAYGGLDSIAVHQDWSGLVTLDSPAKPGEYVHLFGTGFGRVDPQPPDGMPAEAIPLPRTVTPVTCWAWGADQGVKLEIPVTYAGLAPGLVGLYQLDIYLPVAKLRPSTQINCTGEGDNSNFYGSFAVGP